MTKAETRTRLKAARLELTSRQTRPKSRVITKQLIGSLDWRQVSYLHCFATIAELNEPDTKFLFEYVWRNHPNIRTFTSRPVNGKWRQGEIGPAGFYPISGHLPEFDVILMPVLGFDDRNNRIGYGGGYYDKFLATQPKARKIGLAFEVSRTDDLPVEPYDISLDQIITEKSHKQ